MATMATAVILGQALGSAAAGSAVDAVGYGAGFAGSLIAMCLLTLFGVGNWLRDRART